MIDPSLRLRRAIHLNNLVLVKRIINSNPATIRNPDWNNLANTSLHLASSLGAAEIAAFLIDAGHEDECISRNTDGATPLMVAVDTGHEIVAQLIAAQFHRCIDWKDRSGTNALMRAARAGSSSLIAAFLRWAEDPLALVNATDSDGSTALHFAAANGHLKCIRTLLEQGANPGARNTFSWIPVNYSSTVQAEVYFRSLAAEFDRARMDQRERQQEKDRRREGGVRIVSNDDDREAVRETVREGAAFAETERSTPVAVRAQGVATGRIRAGSLE